MEEKFSIPLSRRAWRIIKKALEAQSEYKNLDRRYTKKEYPNQEELQQEIRDLSAVVGELCPYLDGAPYFAKNPKVIIYFPENKEMDV